MAPWCWDAEYNSQGRSSGVLRCYSCFWSVCCLCNGWLQNKRGCYFCFSPFFVKAKILFGFHWWKRVLSKSSVKEKRCNANFWKAGDTCKTYCKCILKYINFMCISLLLFPFHLLHWDLCTNGTLSERSLLTNLPKIAFYHPKPPVTLSFALSVACLFFFLAMITFWHVIYFLVCLFVYSPTTSQAPLGWGHFPTSVPDY